MVKTHRLGVDMVKTVEELKDLIEWAKKTRVKSLKIGEIEVQMSDLAFIDQLGDDLNKAPLATDASTTSTPDWSAGNPTEDKKTEDEDLFWSTR